MWNFTQSERQILLNIAKGSISYGLENRDHIPLNINAYPQKLTQLGASFVTLKIETQLRGCIGSLQAFAPLISDVAHNAYAAAFSDPRFTPLTQHEFTQLEIHISVLSAPEPIEFSSEADLLTKIRPGIDGLILSDQGYRGTFLPSVWEELPSKELFLRHLKMKAGLPADYWSKTIHIERYTTESISE